MDQFNKNGVMLRTIEMSSVFVLVDMFQDLVNRRKMWITYKKGDLTGYSRGTGVE